MIDEFEKILRKELYKRSFYDFARDFWHCADPSVFIDGKVVQFFCETFQYFCRDWVGYEEIEIDVPQQTDDVDVIDVRQSKKNLNINIPPRHSKSMIFNVMGPTWLWTFYPITAVTVSHTTGLASDANSKRAKLIHSYEFQELYGDSIHLISDSRNACKTEEGGDLRSQARESFTGFGADIIINDDLTNAETARRDQAEMASAWSYFQNTMPSRINNPDKMLIMNIQQRLAPNDITGHILENPKLSARYTHIVIPAIFEKDTYLVCPISGDIFFFKKGSALWPERFSDNYESLRDQVGENVFQTQYLQKPISSDMVVFTEDMIEEIDKTEAPGYENADVIYSSHDFPVKDKDTSDYLGSILAYKTNATLYITDCLEKRMAYVASVNYVKQLDTFYPGIIQVIEDKANGSPILQQLQDEVPGMQAFQPGTNSKTQRLESASMYAHNIKFVKTKFDKLSQTWQMSDNLNNLIRRLLAFPLVEHDDIVDAFSQLVLFVFMDRRFMVYGRSFNDANICDSNQIPNLDYSNIFFNKEGDIWKVAKISVKYDEHTKIVMTDELQFKASVPDAIDRIIEFAGDRRIFIDCSATEAMRGFVTKDFTVDRYETDEMSFDREVLDLNALFAKKLILLDKNCKLAKADIENFKYSKTKDETAKYVSKKDGFIACLRTAVKFYGGIY